MADKKVFGFKLIRYICGLSLNQLTVISMNKHTYTFLTLFLLISSLFGNPVRGETYVESITSALDFTDPKVNSQYYMIGTKSGSDPSGNFLKAGDSGSGFTVLAPNGKISEAWPSDEELSAYLWKVEPYRPEGMASYSGYKLKNKKTGLYLKLNLSTTLPTKDDNATYDIFTWFADCTKITDDGACFTLDAYQLYLGSDGKTTIIKNDATPNSNQLYIYTLKPQSITAKILNDSAGDGFTLSATKDGVKLDFPDNPLLDKKLVAMTFVGASSINAEAQKIAGGATTENSRTYFIASGAKKLMALAAESTITFTTGAGGNENAVLDAFKEATFVAVNKTQIYTSDISVTDVGLGYNYATFTGSALLNADVTQVPIENAVFKVTGAEGDNLTITNPEAKFPKDGNMIESVQASEYEPKGVRPFVLTDNLTKQPTLITAPAKGNYTWTPIGFSSSAGSIPADEFKDKSVSVMIVDLEVMKTGTDGKDVVATEVILTGWKISPSSYSTKIESGSTITGYNNTVSFTQAANVIANMPEDCWVLTKEGKFFLLKNRETAQSINLGEIIYQVDEDLYRLKEPLTGDCQGISVKIDSLRLTEVQLNELDGYAHCKAEGDAFDKTVLAETPYRLAITNASYDGTLFYATSYTGELTIVQKQEEGLSFILTPCDTIPYGIYTLDKDEKKVYDLRRVRYALQDPNSGRYVRYDQTQSLCVLDPNVYNSTMEALSNATKFYLKEKGSDQYELLVSTGYNDQTNNYAWVETGGKLKIYANTSAKLSTIGLYSPIMGDKFTLVTKQSELSQDNILNKLLGKSDTTLVRLNFLSTMNGSGSQPWMLAVDNDRFLVEGQPISKPNIDIGTKAQGGLEYEPVHFSLILDTAYVQRAGVTTPLYYIAMPSDKTSEQIQQVGKKTVGYYLFAMTDSIYNSVDKNREDRYCYHFWSQHNPRLRFVQATHEGDTIYIETANPSAKDTIQAGSTEGVALAARQRAWLAAQSEGTAGNPQNNTNKGINYGLFAFEANPKAAEGSLEYALWNPASGRYVTYLNGNVVLTQEPTYYKLDVSRPGEGHFVVANEPVVAEPEAFQVIARSGQVEIRQAAGRQVQIYNILGKELISKRLSSDVETITLPRGIAIVVVEGEIPIKVVI